MSEDYISMEEFHEWMEDLRNKVLAKQGKKIIERNQKLRENG